jgi:hypothetical protein
VPQMIDREGCPLGLVSRAILPPMAALLAALDAFLQGHRRCGELDGGLDGNTVWLVCSCGAQSVHSASAPVVLKEEP